MTGVTSRLAVSALLLLAGLAAGAAYRAAAAAQAPLYDRLGGAAGVAAIAATLIDRVTADPVLGRSFKDSKLD